MGACASALAATALVASCAAPNVYFDPSKSHHRRDGFSNNHVEFEPKGIATVVRWRVSSTIDGLPEPPREPTPTVAPDLAFIRANANPAVMQPAITWLGHSTVLAQFGGLNVLTDPQFSQRASPFTFVGPKRALPPGVALADLPHIDLVVVSHDHYDHLDEASVVALSRQAGGSPLFVVPLGLKPWLANVGITNAIELDWWQSHRVGNAEVVLTPLQHWSGRGLLDRMRSLWGGFAVFASDAHFYFAGDSGYSRDFAEIRARFADRQREGGGFDIAVIPIGGYLPRWFMSTQHVDPGEAVRVHNDLGAKRSVGVHWGTFQLTDERLDDPPDEMARARRAVGLADDAFFVLAVGETRRLPSRLTAR